MPVKTQLNDIDITLLQALHPNGWVEEMPPSLEELGKKVNRAIPSVSERLARMAEDGLVKLPEGKPRAYRLTDEGKEYLKGRGLTPSS